MTETLPVRLKERATAAAAPLFIGNDEVTAGNDVLELVDDMSLMRANETFFEMRQAKLAIERAEAKRLGTLSASARLADMIAVGSGVAGVAKIEVDCDDDMPVVMIEVVPNADPTDVLLATGRALREQFGPATWYRLHVC